MSLQMLRAGHPAVEGEGPRPPAAIHRDFYRWLGQLLLDARFLTLVERAPSMLRSALSTLGSFTLVSGTAYFAYLGRTVAELTPTHCRFHAFAGASGGGPCEVGFFSTPSAPEGGVQTLTKLVSGTVSEWATDGVKGNTAAFDTLIRPGVHLWAGLRIEDAVMPDVVGLTGDMELGYVLEQAGATAFADATSWTGSLVTLTAGTCAPDLRGIV
jgi:hypothetical protein